MNIKRYTVKVNNGATTGLPIACPLQRADIVPTTEAIAHQQPWGSPDFEARLFWHTEDYYTMICIPVMLWQDQDS